MLDGTGVIVGVGVSEAVGSGVPVGVLVGVGVLVTVGVCVTVTVAVAVVVGEGVQLGLTVGPGRVDVSVGSTNKVGSSGTRDICSNGLDWSSITDTTQHTMVVNATITIEIILYSRVESSPEDAGSSNSAMANAS